MNLAELQKAVAKRLGEDPAMRSAGLESLAEDDGDIIAKIGAALAKTGCCAMVVIGGWAPETSASRVMVGSVTVQVLVTETPAVNRMKTGHMTALAAAERAAVVLNLARFESDSLVVTAPGIQFQNGPEGTEIYVVNFKAQHVIAEDAE